MQCSACSEEPHLFCGVFLKSNIETHMRFFWEITYKNQYVPKIVCKEVKFFSFTSTHPYLRECFVHETYQNKGFENLSSQAKYTTDNSNSYYVPISSSEPELLNIERRWRRKSMGNYFNKVNGIEKKRKLGTLQALTMDGSWHTRKLKSHR